MKSPSIYNQRLRYLCLFILLILLATSLLSLTSAQSEDIATEEPTEEIIPTEAPVPTNTPEPTQEIIVTEVVTEEPTLESTVEVTEQPTQEATIEATVEATEEATELPEVTVIPSPTPEATDTPTEEIEVILAPRASYPTSGMVVASYQPTFRWNRVSDRSVQRYEVEVWNATSAMTQRAIVRGTRYKPVNNLLVGFYLWRVRGVDKNGSPLAWSDTQSITIASPRNASPGLYRFASPGPMLTWSAVTWAAAYHVQIDDDPRFDSPDYENNAIDISNLAVTANPLPSGLWHWRIRAQRPDGSWGSWSSRYSLIVDTGS